MTGQTLGPWKISPTINGFLRHIVAQNSLETVCKLSLISKSPCVEADARLSAAAPELHEAKRECVLALENCLDYDVVAMDDTYAPIVIRSVRAVLAKID